LSDGTEEFEFLLSGFSSGLVLVFSGGTEGGGVVPKSLVSVSLGGGGVDDTGLGTNALLELTNFEFEVGKLSLEVGDGGFESGLIGGVLGNGLVFSGGGFLVVSNNLFCEVVQHTLNSLKETLIGFNLGGGHLSQSSQNGGEEVSLSDLNGGLQHTVGVLGELNEVGFTSPDLFEDN